MADFDNSSNPFATRFTRPGALAFRWPAGNSADAIATRLAEHQGWGEIVGPHGSGKSTALAALIPRLTMAGWKCTLVTLRAGDRHWPPAGLIQSEPSTDTNQVGRGLLIVDGYEQLGRLARWRCRRWCRRRNSGLLVTAHGPTGLPTLFQTSTSPELASQLAQQLQKDRQSLDEGQVRAAFTACRGDLRETWFRLFDVFAAARVR